ncbi:helix-turn-helix domain-containing protein [Archaeoglobus profundus]|nr:helix-turn-helix domain-containing protein [Archaeoglobus profundus]
MAVFVLEGMRMSVEELVKVLVEKDSLSEVINSPEFIDLITTLEDESDLRKEVAEKIAKEMGWKGKVRKVDLPDELKDLLEFVYWQGYAVGLNVGRILTAYTIESVVKSFLAKIDQEDKDLRLKIARIFTYFFKDGREVSDVEKNIMKILKEQGFTYRDIAKVTGRSLETIHRYLKAEG